MKKVGQVLKETRLKKGFALDQVESKTKIRQRVLIALEEGQYSKLPAPTFVKGLIKNYADFLSLPASSLLALYRREVADYSSQRLEKNQTQQPLKRIKFTPTITLAGLSFVVLFGLFIYLAIQFLSLTAAPDLNVTSPEPNQVVTSDIVTIVGKTDPGATVLINNEAITIGPQGDFSVDFVLNDGTNQIELVATSKVGKQQKLTRTVEKIKSP